MPQISPMSWIIVTSLLLILVGTILTTMPSIQKDVPGKKEIKTNQPQLKW